MFAEVDRGKVAEVSLELLHKAGDLAGDLGGRVGAFLIGGGVEPLAQELFEHGCDRVVVADREALSHYATLPYADLLVRMVR
ncbi:MAG: hypothetical protein AMK73_00410, partial [Planctomycetes bacterium SM23_32]